MEFLKIPFSVSQEEKENLHHSAYGTTLTCYIIMWIFQENHFNLRGLIQPPIPKEKWLNRNKLVCAYQFISSGLSNKDPHYSVETFCDDRRVLYLHCPVW